MTEARLAGVLALDQGTTNTKAMFVDDSGEIRSIASVPSRTTYPHPGWVESDPHDVWDSVGAASRACLESVPGARVLGIAITNQRESVLAWDRRTSDPVSPLIGWQCRRTAAESERLRTPAVASLIRSKAGLPPDPVYSATKIQWLIRHLAAPPDVTGLCIGTVDAWLVARLTGGDSCACDFTNASRTQLFDLEHLEWSTELLETFAVPASVLPTPLPSSSVFGHVRDFGPVADGTPIVAAIGDSHAAALAHRRFEAGATKATYGTGTSVMTLTDGLPRATEAIASSIAWAVPDVTYCVEANILATGACIQWISEVLAVSLGALEDLARSAGTSDGVVIVPAFVGLGAPYWRADATAVITGLTRATTRGNLAHAALEAAALQVAVVVRAIEESTGLAIEVLQADGGGSTNPLLMQMQADLADRPVLCATSTELSALGAAYVGGITLGLWDTSTLVSMPRNEQRFRPEMAEPMRDRAHARWRDAVLRSLCQDEERRV